MTTLSSSLAQFLELHCNPARPLLLGLSGGPDSLALFHLLLPITKKIGLALHVAHVDHGWRAESADEAKQLQSLAAEQMLPFHCIRLSNTQSEADARQARLDYFQALCDQDDFQAVILGHHADDVVETTLKRILEGVTLPYLSGLQPVVTIDRLTIWRPLLPFSKKEIQGFLDAHHYVAFDDKTNRDPRFLRSRMRTQLLPTLTSQFGKEVKPALAHLAKEAQELRDYMDDRIAPWLTKVIKGPLGSALSLQEDFPGSSYELKYLIRRVVEQQGFYVSREILDAIAHALQHRLADKRAIMGERMLIADRRRLFVLTRSMTHVFWEVSTEKVGKHQLGWQSVWEGEVAVILPAGDYRVERATPSARLALPERQTRLARWWSNCQVPCFLRDHVPVVWDGDFVKAEFLSGIAPVQSVEDSRVVLSCRLLLNPTCATLAKNGSDIPNPRHL